MGWFCTAWTTRQADEVSQDQSRGEHGPSATDVRTPSIPQVRKQARVLRRVPAVQPEMAVDQDDGFSRLEGWGHGHYAAGVPRCRNREAVSDYWKDEERRHEAHHGRYQRERQPTTT